MIFMSRKHYLYLLLFFIVSSGVVAQNNSIKLLAKVKGEAVWLRWAPTNPTVWKWGNQFGYQIERFTLAANGEIENPLGEKLTTLPIKIYSMNELDKLSTSVKEATAIKELVYGQKAVAPFNTTNPASILAKNKEQQNSFGLALLVCDFSRPLAEAAGLFFKDESARKGKRYIYRVSLGYVSKDVEVEPGVIVLDVKDEAPLNPPNRFEVAFDNKKATLSWSTLLDRGVYTAYHIEKSEDGRDFTRITKLPYINVGKSLQSETAFFVDSLKENNKKYYYRIFGVTPFAENGQVTKVIEGQGKDDLSGSLILREGIVNDNKSVTLKWEFPSIAENQIAGFIISRTSGPSKSYEEINRKPLPPETREYKDIPKYNNSYYVIKAVDLQGEERVKSFPYLVQIEDKTPPDMPIGLKGGIDKNGIALLKWGANKDTDLKGYRIFKSNKPTDEFIEITRSIITDTSYVDTTNIKVLNKKVYYKVIAVDRNFNTSDYTNYLALTKPDVIAPISPVFRSVELKGSEIEINWENGSSDDVAFYALFRNSKMDTLKQKLVEWKPSENKNFFVDKMPQIGNTYRYYLVARDSSGNFANAKSKEVYYETGIRPAVTLLKSSVDREKKTIKLQWSNYEIPQRVIVYRKENNAPFTLYETVEGDAESFLDKGRNISINNFYTYKVQPIYKNGVKASISAEVKVNF
jgi:uncharacterized protein